MSRRRAPRLIEQHRIHGSNSSTVTPDKPATNANPRNEPATASTPSMSAISKPNRSTDETRTSIPTTERETSPPATTTSRTNRGLPPVRRRRTATSVDDGASPDHRSHSAATATSSSEPSRSTSAPRHKRSLPSAVNDDWGRVVPSNITPDPTRRALNAVITARDDPSAQCRSSRTTRPERRSSNTAASTSVSSHSCSDGPTLASTSGNAIRKARAGWRSTPRRSDAGPAPPHNTRVPARRRSAANAFTSADFPTPASPDTSTSDDAPVRLRARNRSNSADRPRRPSGPALSDGTAIAAAYSDEPGPGSYRRPRRPREHRSSAKERHRWHDQSTSPTHTLGAITTSRPCHHHDTRPRTPPKLLREHPRTAPPRHRPSTPAASTTNGRLRLGNGRRPPRTRNRR